MQTAPALPPTSPTSGVLAPAKVNLRLEVVGRRPDGFHDIRSLAMAVGLFDELRCTDAPAGRLELSCDDPTLGCGEENLVIRAARMLARRTGVKRGATIELVKRIPIGAGLGGGSSDAAAALRELNEVWRTGVPEEELAAWGAEIGSDVPLFFSVPTAVITGRGERTRPAPMRWSGWVLLIFGAVPVSTAEVYRAWTPDDSHAGRGDEIARMTQADNAAELAELACNDLEPAVFRVCPQVRRLFDRAGSLGLAVRVSGAGSTLFALFDHRSEAEGAAVEIKTKGIRCLSVGAGDNPPMDPNGQHPDDRQ